MPDGTGTQTQPEQVDFKVSSDVVNIQMQICIQSASGLPRAHCYYCQNNQPHMTQSRDRMAPIL